MKGSGVMRGVMVGNDQDRFGCVRVLLRSFSDRDRGVVLGVRDLDRGLDRLGVDP